MTDGTGARWLRTGDLARRDAAGRLHLAGRRDRQVLVKCYRVTLEELESVARACAGVSDAVAEVVGDGGGQVVRVWCNGPPGPRSARMSCGPLAAVPPVTVVPARVIMVDRLAVGETSPNAPQREPEAVDHGSVADGPVGRLAAAVLGRPLEEAMNFFDAGFTRCRCRAECRAERPAATTGGAADPVPASQPARTRRVPVPRAVTKRPGRGGGALPDGRAQRPDQMRARRHQARRWASRREDGQR